MNSIEIKTVLEGLREQKATIKLEISRLHGQVLEIDDEAIRLNAELRNQLRLEAEQERINGLNPNFDDPRLQAYLLTLEKLPIYDTLRSYQKEAIVMVLDRYIKGQDGKSTYGFIEADDAGLGKTAVTAAFLRTLEHS